MPKTATPPKTEFVRARIDAQLKAEAEAVLDKVGLTASEAIRLLFVHAVREGGLPFDLRVTTEKAKSGAGGFDK